MLNADFVATGHYARVEKLQDRYSSKRALMHEKTIRYVLFSLNQINSQNPLSFGYGNERVCAADRQRPELKNQRQTGEPGYLLCPR